MSKIPPPLARRDILYGKSPPVAVLQEYGELYLREGRPNDAVEFFGQAGYTEGLRRICAVAIEEGDFFLFSRAKEFLREDGLPRRIEATGRERHEARKISICPYLF